jgi:hypothetical protein
MNKSSKLRVEIDVLNSESYRLKGTALKRTQKIKGVSVKIYKDIPCEECETEEKVVSLGRKLKVAISNKRRVYRREVLATGSAKLFNGKKSEGVKPDKFDRATGVNLSLKRILEQNITEEVRSFCESLLEIYKPKQQKILVIDKRNNE